MQNWEQYIFENDAEAAANIMLGANYSGRAINITQTTAAHAMSYKITSLYGIPHGHAVAICLPELWKYMIDNMDKCIDKRGAKYLGSIFDEIAYAMGANTPIDAVRLFRNMMKQMELQNPTSEKKEEDLEILSSSVNPTRLKNNPIALVGNITLYLYKLMIL